VEVNGTGRAFLFVFLNPNPCAYGESGMGYGGVVYRCKPHAAKAHHHDAQSGRFKKFHLLLLSLLDFVADAQRNHRQVIGEIGV
jgi:hypothetical protein